VTSDPAPPELPTAALDSGGWELADERVETVFELPTMQVRSATRRYEDEQIRAALRNATDGRLDRTVRFFAGTRLVFEPPLPPGVTPSMVAPTLRTEARQAFADRLRERGLVDVERGTSQRVRVAGRNRAHLTKYTAVDPLDGDVGESDAGDGLRLACWLAVWTRSESARVVTGGYPAAALATQFGLDATDGPLARTSESFREEFLSLLRDVE
jgi:hypothetical protein